MTTGLPLSLRKFHYVQLQSVRHFRRQTRPNRYRKFSFNKASHASKGHNSTNKQPCRTSLSSHERLAARQPPPLGSIYLSTCYDSDSTEITCLVVTHHKDVLVSKQRFSLARNQIKTPTISNAGLTMWVFVLIIIYDADSF